MSFIVRQISRTADGREIIRPRTFDQPELSIGRNTGCDIHLPDLAVTLNHATIRQTGPSRAEIVAVAGLPFDVDGRSTERADLDAQRGANIRIGAHVIAVSRDAEADAIVLTVERVGAVSDASEVIDEDRAFSLGSALPGKRVMAWSFIGLVLAVFLAWPLWSFYTNSQAADPTGPRPIAFHADEMWSTGKLSQAHAQLENDCKACHVQPGVAVRDSSCVACHDTLHDHADPARLAAARFEPGAGGKAQLAFKSAFNVPEGRCVDCHTEHEGATAMPVTEQKFCSDCHADLKARLTDTAILNASDFGTDHPQFRPAVRTSAMPPVVQRLSLDARPIEDNGLKFPHNVHLSTTNGVARMAQTMQVEFGFGKSLACADCHVPDPSGTRFRPITMEQNCQMCHSLAFDKIEGTVRTLRHGDPKQVVADLRAFYRSTGPVQPINLGGNARRRPGDFAAQATSARFSFASATRYGRADPAIRATFSEGGVCFECHKVVAPSQSGTGTFGIVPVKLPDRYMRKGWFDHAAHQTETCVSCHAAPTSASAGDLLLPKIESCRTCHGGETAHKEVKSSCAMCHDFHRDDAAPLMVRDSRERGKRVDNGRALKAIRRQDG
ncbi:cytochrome c3 family protein [Sphingomonas solaris]|uniref:Cytochrome C n=1 Tax=Alterirhizorhabdus solaris TaxID=2529389 RepID=A0A558QZC4_9SPHN|nr:cytochrome c3 family protein [Sphingomonas solaris]TVV72480.1 cytochrome C [Sphingomonas solaris]